MMEQAMHPGELLVEAPALGGEGMPRPGSIPTPMPAAAPHRPRLRRWLWPGLIAVAAAGGAAFLAASPTSRGRAVAMLNDLVARSTRQAEATSGAEPEAEPPPPPSFRDGKLELTGEQVESIGVATATVAAQVEPTHLPINGTTAYDANTQVQIRPRFTSVIDQVHASVGEHVEEGQPLVDLFSAELAAAKSEYEKAQARWEHDRRELDRARKLFEASPPAISEKEYLSLADDEKVSRVDAKVAADKLEVYGLTADEIKLVPSQGGRAKAMMTLRAPASGIVIKKDAVRGNRYSDTDVLLVIAPLDHLWVWGNVYPADAGLVAIGQRWVVTCPLANCAIESKVESIATEVAQDTKTVRIRTQVENVGGRLKAAMLVGGYVEIPPHAGNTVIPREAMISAGDQDYVLLALSGDDGRLLVERRPIQVERESRDRVIVASGLRPGDEVVTRGSLILAQVIEDAELTRPTAAE